MDKEVKELIGARLGTEMSPNRVETTRICEMMDRVVQNYYMEFTDFLEPEVRLLVEEVAARYYKAVALLPSGGFAEQDGNIGDRCMLAVMSKDLRESLGSEPIAYPLLVIKLTSTDARFEPRHRDVLGSLMGLGMRRERVGDIRIDTKSKGPCENKFNQTGSCVYIAIEASMLDFIKSHMVKIGPWEISISVAEQEELLGLEDDGEPCSFTVKSMRLDALLAEGFNLSRDVASKLAESGKVKINQRVVESKSKEIHSGDLISARGFGRLRIVNTGDRTRKDRLWVEALRYR